VINDFLPAGGIARSVMFLYTREILSGLDYLHSVPPAGILHRDIKPANVLLLPRAVDGAHVKLADFGMSKVLRENSVMSQKGSIVGTVPYMSPQAVQGNFTAGADLWAVGCTVLQMATGYMPWYETEKKGMVLMYHIGSSESHNPRIPDDFAGTRLEDFLRACFKAEKHSTTCSTLRDHPLMRIACEDEAAKSDLHDFLLKEDEKVMQQKEMAQRGWDSTHSITKASEQWQTSFSYTATTAPSDPYGSVFKDEKSLTWDTLWQRISQLPRFSGIPFRDQYGHILPLVQYIMCRRGMDGVDDTPTVSFHDDFCPLQMYFQTVESMIEDIGELNRRRLFRMGASTQDTERVLGKAEAGAMLVRPSKSEPGKLALSVLNDSRQTKHYFIVRQPVPGGEPQYGKLHLFGRAGGPEADSLRELIDILTKDFTEEFRYGAGEVQAKPAGGIYVGQPS